MSSLRWVVLISVLGFASMASAQQAQRQYPLFFATGTLGFGDCGGGYCRHFIDGNGRDEADTGPFFGLGAGFFIRPIPYFAGGVYLHYQMMGADDENRDRFDESAAYFLANLAIRGILPIDKIDLFAELGLGYGWWGYAYNRDGDRSDEITYDGLDLMLGLGLDYALTDQWAIGGIFRFGFPSWSSRCRERLEPGSSDLDCGDWDVLDVEERDEAPESLWYLGFTGSFRFGG